MLKVLPFSISICVVCFVVAISGESADAQTRIGDTRLGSRTVPLPTDISRQLQEFISNSEPLTDRPVPNAAAGWIELRSRNDLAFAEKARASADAFGVTVKSKDVGHVRCYLLTPKTITDRNRNRLLIHVHGGAYVFAAGVAATWEGVHVANACNTDVLSIDYRMPPEHPFPASIDDVVLVWKHLIAEHPGKKLGLFGSSAGGGLALATTLKLRDSKLRLPDAMFLGTPWADLTKSGDTYFANAGLDAVLGQYEGLLESAAKLYAGDTQLSHPLVSPINGDFDSLPPTILISGTRDLFLSNTVRTHRKLRRAGVPADLHVFEGQSHGHYLLAHPCPESDEALLEVARFFDIHL